MSAVGPVGDFVDVDRHVRSSSETRHSSVSSARPLWATSRRSVMFDVDLLRAPLLAPDTTTHKSAWRSSAGGCWRTFGRNGNQSTVMPLALIGTAQLAMFP